MIANDLNIILAYLNDPSLEKSKVIFTQYFDNDVREEFFWMKASLHNPDVVFTHINVFNPHYFTTKWNDIVSKANTGDAFFAIVFLQDLAKYLRRKNTDFTSLISIIDSLIDSLKDREIETLQLVWAIAESIIEFPLDDITNKHLNFLKKALKPSISLVATDIEEILLPRILEEGKKELLINVIKEVLFGYSINKDLSFTRVIPVYDTYYLSKITSKKNLNSFIRILGVEKISQVFIDLINDVSRKNQYEFSSISIPSIEDTDQNWNADSLEYQAVKSLRDIFTYEKPSADLIKNKFMETGNTILDRIGIHLIGQHYDELSSLFWNWNKGNPLNFSEAKHEIFTLIKKNVGSFDSKNLEKLFTWIDQITIEPWNQDVTKIELEQARALTGKEYLAALSEIDSSLISRVAEKKAELNAIYQYEREHPGFNSYHSMSSGYDHPDSFEDFSRHTTTTESLVDYFNNKKTTWSTFEFEGQKERLQNLFAKKPELANEVEKLLKLDFEFLPSVIYGLNKALQNEKTINWSSVFTIMENVIQLNGDDGLIKKRNALVGYCAWIIRDTTKDDKITLEGGVLIRAKEICLKFLELNILSERLNKDPFFDILNSPEGKILEATLNVLLKNARENNKEAKDKWFQEVKSHYTNVFSKSKYNDAYIYNVAGYLPQYGYLDIEWIRDNINYIFPKKDSFNWKFAMRCYTRMTSTLYKDIFDILLKNGHYDIGIDTFRGDEIGTADFVQHIIISHIAKWDGQGLNDKKSLINKVIEKADKQQIKSIISYLFVNKTYSPEVISSIWTALINIKFESEEDKEEINHEILKLTTRINEIDDHVFELISRTLDSTKNRDNLFEMVRSLIHSERNDIINRAKLLMVGSGNYLNRHSSTGQFEKMTRELYKRNKGFANEFVDSMLKKRVYSLLEVYNEMNS